MLNNLEHIKETLRPYIDIILFVVALLAANYFWKFTVWGDEDGTVRRFIKTEICDLSQSIE